MTSNSSKEFSIMGFFKTFALGAGLAVGLTAAAQAETLAIRMYQGSISNANLIPGSAVSSVTGALTDIVSNANFANVTVSAQGVPIIPTPNLSSVAITATSGQIAGPVKLIILINQSGLSSTSVLSLQNSFTANVLTGAANYSGMTLSHYINENNCGLCTQQLMTTTSYSGAGPTFQTGPTSYAAPADLAWSETMIYEITFTGPGASISITSQIIAEKVPEPMTIALLGAGLLGLAAARRRKAA